MNITISPTPEEYEEVVKKVQKLFPNEKDEVYYERPLKSDSHQKQARGRFYDRFRGKKARYGLCSVSKKRQVLDTPASTSCDWVLSEETALSVDFLAKWQEPIEEVNQQWVELLHTASDG